MAAAVLSIVMKRMIKFTVVSVFTDAELPSGKQAIYVPGKTQIARAVESQRKCWISLVLHSNLARTIFHKPGGRKYRNRYNPFKHRYARKEDSNRW